MAVYGHLSEFNTTEGIWDTYFEQLEFYLEANGITDPATKKAVFLSSCGDSCYRLLRNLIAPDRPKDKNFDELIAVLQTHFSPAPSVTLERFRFNTTVRAPSQSISSYVAHLRNLAQHCAFENQLDNHIRDRLVCGVNDEGIQKRLFSEKDLTLTKALEIALAMEKAEQNSTDVRQLSRGNQAVHHHSTHAAAHKPQSTPDRGKKKPCYRCLGPHLESECRFRQAECYNCHKKGHIGKACKSKSQGKGGNYKGRGRHSGPHKTHQINQDGTEKSTESTVYELFQTVRNKPRSPPITANISMNKKLVEMEVDTGASASLISEKLFNDIWTAENRPSLEPRTDILKTYTGQLIKTKGVIVVDVEHDGQKKKLSLLVVPGNGPALLGRDWLSELRLNWQQIHAVTANVNSCVAELVDKYCDIFKEELGTLKDVEVKFDIKDSITRKFHKARPVPYAIRNMVSQEIDRLESLGIIQPVKHSEIAAPIVPVVKNESSKVRICGDFRTTINSISNTESYPIPRIEDLHASLTGGKHFTKLDLSNAYLQVLIHPEHRYLTTINTHKGLYQFTRLAFGISSAPVIFQCVIEFKEFVVTRMLF